jgi:ATP phosphoribosyltransferase regulatory subunit
MVSHLCVLADGSAEHLHQVLKKPFLACQGGLLGFLEVAMKKTSIGLPAGYRDFLFDEARLRRRTESALALLFEERGFGEVTPSAVEYQDLYRRGNQAVADRTVKFLDREDHLLALRADFTPAIARVVASRLSGGPLPLKVWYSGNVFRKVDPKRGRYCEFGQVGVELVGLNTLERDQEIVSLALEALSRLNISGAIVLLNHAGIFRGIVEDLQLDRKSLKQVKAAIDRKDARDLASQLEILKVSDSVHDQLAALAGCTGGPEVLDRAAVALSNRPALKSLEELKVLGEGLKTWGGAVQFDLAEIDEMEYYTGIMFTVFHPRLSSELGRGGRYDTLLREFGPDMPAVGFSFSLDALLELV